MVSSQTWRRSPSTQCPQNRTQGKYFGVDKSQHVSFESSQPSRHLAYRKEHSGEITTLISNGGDKVVRVVERSQTLHLCTY